VYVEVYGCPVAQGYLFSPPVDRDAFLALLASWDVRRFSAPGSRHSVATATVASGAMVGAP
jgi:hypothetical protein